jgi:hypothetical protein
MLTEAFVAMSEVLLYRRLVGEGEIGTRTFRIIGRDSNIKIR